MTQQEPGQDDMEHEKNVLIAWIGLFCIGLLIQIFS